MRRAPLGIERCLQGTGTQCIIGVQKNDILAPGCSQTGIARAGNTAVLLMDDRDAGIPRRAPAAPISAQRAGCSYSMRMLQAS